MYNNNFIKNNYKTNKYSFLKVIKYFTILNLNLPHSFLGLTGFSIFVVIGFQVITGIFLATGYIPEPMIVPVSRETEDIEGYFIDDIFWLHERSVDILMFLIYGHILRKLYIGPTAQQTEHSWKTGVFIYLFLQVVIFFGIVLCSSQLSEITLRIAANIIASITRFWTELDWIIFTDRSLNSDTLIRMTILHYLTGILVPFFGLIHGVEMHYDWKSEVNYTGLKESVNWLDEGLINELIKFIITVWVFIFLSSLLFKTQEPISYEIFTWFDLGILDIKYKGVAPHWYFRPYMGWLGTLPDHYGGLVILFLFHILFYYQPDLMGKENKFNPFNSNFYKGEQDNSLIFKGLNQNINPQYNLVYNITFIIFTFSLWYVGSFLPYGLMFHSIGGNIGLLIADLYIFFYLLFPRLRGQYSYILMLSEVLNIIKVNNISNKVYTKYEYSKQKTTNLSNTPYNFGYTYIDSYLNSLKPSRLLPFVDILPYSNKVWYEGRNKDIIAYKKYLLKLSLGKKTKKVRTFIRIYFKCKTYLFKKKVKSTLKSIKFTIKSKLKDMIFYYPKKKDNPSSYYFRFIKSRLVSFISRFRHSDKIWYGETNKDIIAYKKYLLKLYLGKKTIRVRRFIRMYFKSAVYLFKKKVKSTLKFIKFTIKSKLKDTIFYYPKKKDNSNSYYFKFIKPRLVSFISRFRHSDKIWYGETNKDTIAYKKYLLKLYLGKKTIRVRRFIRMYFKSAVYLFKKKVKSTLKSIKFTIKSKLKDTIFYYPKKKDNSNSYYFKFIKPRLVSFISRFRHSDKIWYGETNKDTIAYKKYLLKLYLGKKTIRVRRFIRMYFKSAVYLFKKKVKSTLKSIKFTIKSKLKDTIFYYPKKKDNSNSYYFKFIKPRLVSFISRFRHSDKIWYGETNKDIIAYKKYLLKLYLGKKTIRVRRFIRMYFKSAVYLFKKKVKSTLKSTKLTIKSKLKNIIFYDPKKKG